MFFTLPSQIILCCHSHKPPKSFSSILYGVPIESQRCTRSDLSRLEGFQGPFFFKAHCVGQAPLEASPVTRLPFPPVCPFFSLFNSSRLRSPAREATDNNCLCSFTRHLEFPLLRTVTSEPLLTGYVSLPTWGDPRPGPLLFGWGHVLNPPPPPSSVQEPDWMPFGSRVFFPPRRTSHFRVSKVPTRPHPRHPKFSRVLPGLPLPFFDRPRGLGV